MVPSVTGSLHPHLHTTLSPPLFVPSPFLFFPHPFLILLSLLFILSVFSSFCLYFSFSFFSLQPFISSFLTLSPDFSSPSYDFVFFLIISSPPHFIPSLLICSTSVILLLTFHFLALCPHSIFHSYDFLPLVSFIYFSSLPLSSF